jgi:hypothetical protein
VVGVVHEDDLGRLDRIGVGEGEAQAEGAVRVDGVLVEDLDVHMPDEQVARSRVYELDARRDALMDLIDMIRSGDERLKMREDSY